MSPDGSCAGPDRRAPCPDPLTRAPRITTPSGAPTDWLRLPPASLQGALVALVGRDTRGLQLDAAQRLSHYPSSPCVSLSWLHGIDVGAVRQGPHGPEWEPLGADCMVSGTQAHPVTTWAETTGHGCMAIFRADAARALFGLDLASIQDRFVCAADVMGPEWTPMWEALLASPDADLIAVLERHLARRWQALSGRATDQPSLRQIGRHWVERLAWHAHEWSREHSPRHVERRIKSFSGRSLREWQAIVRTEGLFFAARDRHEAGKPFDWATLALDEGFADQAHMTRTVRRITGFTPTEFARRFVEDESFWLYRLWA
jgi:AraC-like DNA-binding protein